MVSLSPTFAFFGEIFLMTGVVAAFFAAAAVTTTGPGWSLWGLADAAAGRSRADARARVRARVIAVFIGRESEDLEHRMDLRVRLDERPIFPAFPTKPT